jgi:hypothetical protein
MALTNLAPARVRVSDAGRKTTVPPIQPAKERKASSKKMRLSGLNERRGRRQEPEAAKEKAKEKGKRMATGIGKVKEPEGTQGNHLVLTIAKEMAIANGVTTVVSLTTDLRGVRGSQRQWQPKSPPRSKRSR